MSNRPDTLRDEHLVSMELASASTAPATWYTDPQFHRWEQETVFASAWQLVGHESSVSTPGDYLVSDIAGAPVLVVRDKEGSLNAFYNVCRHRAGPVAQGQGNCQLLRCRYHGWVYGLDGALRHAPELGEATGFEPDQNGLHGIESCKAQSLLFVRRNGDRPVLVSDIDQLMSAINKRIAPQDISSQTLHQRVSYTMRCNWKVYVDNYLEGYHIPQVHPELADVLDYRDYTTETFAGYSLQHSKIETATAAYNAGKAFYYFIFPNVMLNILPGRLQTNAVIPLAHDRCRVDFDYYYTDTESPRAREQIEQDLEFGDLVQKQDGDICERVQMGLESGVYDQGRMSVRREAGVHHFQECLRAVFRQA